MVLHKKIKFYIMLYKHFYLFAVPRKVLREPYDSVLEDDGETDIIEEPDYDVDYDTIGDTVIYRDRNGHSYSPSPKLSAPNISGNTSLLQPPPSHVSPPPPYDENSSKGNSIYVDDFFYNLGAWLLLTYLFFCTLFNLPFLC